MLSASTEKTLFFVII